jgi:hypothetical protein
MHTYTTNNMWCSNAEIVIHCGRTIIFFPTQDAKTNPYSGCKNQTPHAEIIP